MMKIKCLSLAFIIVLISKSCFALYYVYHLEIVDCYTNQGIRTYATVGNHCTGGNGTNYTDWEQNTDHQTCTAVFYYEGFADDGTLLSTSNTIHQVSVRPDYHFVFPDGESCLPDCYAEEQAVKELCGDNENIDWIWTDKAGCNAECKENCDDKRLLKIAECGGEQYLENWNNDTCTGNCFCEEIPLDDLNTPTYMQMKGFCSGSGLGLDSYEKSLCIGACKSCDEQFAIKRDYCLANGMEINRNSPNAKTCEYDCLPNCSLEWDLLVESCGSSSQVDRSTWDEESCSGLCIKDCTSEWDDLQEKCGIAGVDEAHFNNQDCSGKCKDCQYLDKTCKQECGGSGYLETCNVIYGHLGNIIGIDEGKCICDDLESLWGEEGDLAEDFDPAVGGDPSQDGYAFGNPGQYGGTVTNNPDGTVTESFSDGKYIVYSADGKEIVGFRGDGTKITKILNSDGSVRFYSTDNEGITYEIIETHLADGRIKTERRLVVDVNKDNPELEPDYQIVPDSKIDITYTVGSGGPGGTGGTIDGSPVVTAEEAQEVANVEGSLKLPASKILGEATLISWDPITMGVNSLLSKAPFNVPSQISQIVDGLVVSAKAPSFDLDLGFVNYEIKLDIMSGFMSTIRAIISFFMVIGTLWGIVKMWRNM